MTAAKIHDELWDEEVELNSESWEEEALVGPPEDSPVDPLAVVFGVALTVSFILNVGLILFTIYNMNS